MFFLTGPEGFHDTLIRDMMDWLVLIGGVLVIPVAVIVGIRLVGFVREFGE